MKRKILFVALTVALVAAVIGGATMASFTAKAEVENTFTAGTVMIEAGEEVVYGESSMANVNPGDAFKKCIPIENTGTKNIRLSMTAQLEYEIAWDELDFDAHCFSSEWDSMADLQAAVEAALAAGNVTNPADAMGYPNGPFDKAGNLVIPVMIAPAANVDWFMKDVDGKLVFFYDGILAPGAETKLCYIVIFDGPWMGNLWQGATFTINGLFQAVQSSNDAPQAVWGDAVWANYENVSALTEPRDRLEYDFGTAYADYFYDDYTFKYAYLCEFGNGEYWYETAFGGDFEGDSAAWWYFFDTQGPETQQIYVAQTIDGGTVTVAVLVETNGNGLNKITIDLDHGWELQDYDQAVKIQGYDDGELPDSRPAAGTFTTYKGNELEVEVPAYRYYVIHLDVQKLVN